MGRKPSGSEEIGWGCTGKWKRKTQRIPYENGKAKPNEKVCTEFAPAAQRIRVQLSGEGINISYCPTVPKEICEEAKEKKIDNVTEVEEDRKKIDNMTEVEEDSKKIDNVTEVEEDRKKIDNVTEVEEDRKKIDNVTEVEEDRNAALALDMLRQNPTKKSVQGRGGENEEAYLKFLMCTDHSTISLCPLEYLKNPLFMKLMERAGGIPVDPTQLSMAALKIKQEVETHMLTVKTQFWNTTGRTLMLINHETERVVVIYCPKGIFFVKPTTSDLNRNYSYYQETLQLHSPRLCADEGVQWLSHCVNVETDNACGCELYSTDSWNKYPPSGEICNCLLEEIRLSCEKICSESEWAKNLIDVAEKIHWCAYQSKDAWCDYSANKKATRLEMFMSIIPFVRIRESTVPEDPPVYSDIDQITKETKFWDEGENLEMILRYVMGMGYMMDTIVPTAGYLGIALDKVDHDIELDTQDLVKDALQFWRMLKSDLQGRIRGSRLAASYLNPVYFLQQLKKDNLLPIKVLKAALRGFAIRQRLNLEKIEKEVDSFADVFNRVQDLEDYHPVILWEKHGSGLPNLQKCAVMLLNRPLCCMSKQVKKHLYNLDPYGAPDYITTLNLRMMLHLERLGDDIYKPLDLSELDYMWY